MFANRKRHESQTCISYFDDLPAASRFPHLSFNIRAAKIAVKMGIVKLSTVASRKGNTWMLHTFQPNS